MKVFFTKEKQWLEKWDEFVSKNERGSHLILSDWLQSYQSYGFDFEIGLFLENEKIVGGYGAVIAKMAFFKFYIVPHGPIFTDNFEENISFGINELYLRATKLKCCYAQYSIPFSTNKLIESNSYHSNIKNNIKNLGAEGSLFKHIYSSYGINWVSFNTASNPDELLQQFALQPRRNINLAYRNHIEITYSQTEEDCKLAYSLIEDNAKFGNYSVRAFQDFKNTMLSLIAKKRAFLLTVNFADEIKGAAFVVDCGNYLTYISGGTKKEKPDLNIGYVIHWEIIKKSYELGYKGYNISMGGSKGVQDFKSKFMAQSVLFDTPHYHLVLKPNIFKIYLFLNKYFKKNKERISVILKKIK